MARWLTLGVAFLLVSAPVSAQTDAVDAIRDRLDQYLLAYEPVLSTLVADERMTQRDGSRESRAGYATANREVVSEVGFVSLPGDAGWLGFRRVVAVDGKKLGNAGPTLAALLSDGASGSIAQARLLLEQSAAHNLGAPRTTNLPNLPLEFLHPRNRPRLHHRLDGMEKIRGVQTARIVFEEHATPTIIRTPQGADMQSVVTAWVEPDTGRLLRAEVKTREARVGAVEFDEAIWVDFRVDAKLDVLVPYEMKEQFFTGRFREGTGTSRYTNYRQFKTSARIVPRQ